MDMDPPSSQDIFSPTADTNGALVPFDLWNDCTDFNHPQFNISLITMPWDQLPGSRQSQPASPKVTVEDAIDQKTGKPLDRIYKAVFPDGNGQEEHFKAALKSGRDRIELLHGKTPWNTLPRERQTEILNAAFRDGFADYFR